MKRHARLSLLPILLFASLALLGAAGSGSKETASSPSSNPKYIFIFLSDGAGITHMEITRMYSRIIHNEGLNVVDKIIKQGSVGLITTHAANALSTDSAAAATALASGCKAKIGAIGSCEDGSISKTVMEVAKENGMRIGLITNSTLYDASPAAFAGHVPDRTLFSPIIDQYLKLEPDLLMGGGRDAFLPRSQPGSRRKDDSDMIGAFVKRGYVYVANKDELVRAKASKILGLFSLAEINFEIDRHETNEPSVSEMTRAAIRELEGQSSGGFVLFVEDEHVDTAAHLLDIASLIHEYREFDRAVGRRH
jgi:alkaline phosphatase